MKEQRVSMCKCTEMKELEREVKHYRRIAIFSASFIISFLVAVIISVIVMLLQR